MNKSSSHSPASKLNFAGVIDNDVSRCQLLDVSKLPLPPDIKCPQSQRGPYVVLQKARCRGTFTANRSNFCSQKKPLFAFLKLPEQERYELCTFSIAAEAIQQLERLAGRAMPTHPSIRETNWIRQMDVPNVLRRDTAASSH
jgi:hypothetical protein